MTENRMLKYVIKDPVELNLSYMPFISNGGIFVPTPEPFFLRDTVVVDLQLPGKKEGFAIEGKVVWIIPKNALHHVLAGVGVQFTGSNSHAARDYIEANLDSSVEVGGYTHGIQRLSANR